MKRLQREIDDAFDNVEEIRMTKLAKCQYLKACVDESLRLAPPGPGMPPRTILKGGTIIDGEVFPEGVRSIRVFQLCIAADKIKQINVGGAAWTYAYNPQNYPDPEVFRPERYLPVEGGSPEQVDTAKNSYWPFQTGVRKCPGMKMAYQELYITIARLLYLFEITPEQPQELKSNFDILDHFSELISDHRSQSSLTKDARCQEVWSLLFFQTPGGQKAANVAHSVIDTIQERYCIGGPTEHQAMTSPVVAFDYSFYLAGLVKIPMSSKFVFLAEASSTSLLVVCQVAIRGVDLVRMGLKLSFHISTACSNDIYSPLKPYPWMKSRSIKLLWRFSALS